jgi:ATP-dependent exoDNAse (exonuclease V) beta subunit
MALQPAAGGRKRGWQSVSPSQLEGGPTLRMQNVLRPARQGGEDYGTLIHTWLAHYTWLHDSAPDDDMLHRIALAEAHWQHDPAPQIQQLRQRLAEPTLQQILDENTYSAAYRQAFPHLGLSAAATRRVHCELRFAQRDAQQLTTGSIDRLVLWQEAGKIVAADILDYKTDALPPGDAAALAAKVEHYRPQLAAYVLAVEQRYQLAPDRITARLLFLSAGEMVDVSPHTKAKLAAQAERTRP